MTLRHTIRVITGHPMMALLTALILIVTGAAKAWETIEQDIAEARLGAHLGVLLLGLVSLVGAIPDVVEGLERLVAHREDRT